MRVKHFATDIDWRRNKGHEITGEFSEAALRVNKVQQYQSDGLYSNLCVKLLVPEQRGSVD